MKRWRFTPAARGDMEAIWHYTADRWGIDQAERYIRQVEHDLAAAAADSPLVRPLDAYLRIKSGHHVCIFRKQPDGQIVVVRVLHERMDVKTKLGD